jgi:hypothetical protein
MAPISPVFRLSMFAVGKISYPLMVFFWVWMAVLDAECRVAIDSRRGWKLTGIGISQSGRVDPEKERLLTSVIPVLYY